MTDCTSSQIKYGIVISPLRKGMFADETAKYIFYMAKSFGIKIYEISGIIINNEYGYAKLEVYNKRCENILMQSLQADSLKNLVANPENFSKFRISTLDGRSNIEDGDGKLAHTETGNAEKQMKTNEISVKNVVKDSRKYPRRTMSAMMLTFNEMSKEKPLNRLHTVAFTSDISNDDLGSRNHDPDTSEAPAKHIVKTSTTSPNQCLNQETCYYRMKQVIGTDSKNCEFKKGLNVYVGYQFLYNIGRNVCGFLNSEGGTIYFGVDDDGTVVGVEISKYFEKILRYDIDFAIRLIEPKVHKNEYSVNFVRVMLRNGVLSRNIKVLEVCLKPRRPTGKPYCYKNIQYIRRDGGTHKIEQKDIKSECLSDPIKSGHDLSNSPYLSCTS